MDNSGKPSAVCIEAAHEEETKRVGSWLFLLWSLQVKGWTESVSMCALKCKAVIAYSWRQKAGPDVSLFLPSMAILVK